MEVPRPAATLVLVREVPSGPEVLLVQRISTAAFGPGAWVFPGGAVDREDLELGVFYPELVERLAVQMSLEPFIAGGYLGAALRETLEETGILVGLDSYTATDRDVGLSALLRTLHSASTPPLLEDIIYLSRWITPSGLSRRYDTRFFVAPVGNRCEAILSLNELTASLWVRPAEALERQASGALLMMPPTVATLKTLAPYTSREEMWRELRERPRDSYLSAPTSADDEGRRL
jgi:8-oxo-dGTP pyrophosphatase MutT (NUDIX family)